MRDYILVDGSYFCFFRYHALLTWWKNAHKDEPLGDSPIENAIFLEKFKKIFKQKLLEIVKKFATKNATVIIGKDCPRKEIWRNDIYEQYKATRDSEDVFLGGPFFKLAYDELFTDYQIISHPRLEADDCIALYTKHLIDTLPDVNVTIITSDMDYLQLHRENVQIYDLKWKSLMTSKCAFPTAVQNLFCKIVMGDKSDNITSVFKKCGIKTAAKMYENQDEFIHRLNTHENANALYQRNKTLVDFNEIPIVYVNEFKKTHLQN